VSAVPQTHVAAQAAVQAHGAALAHGASAAAPASYLLLGETRAQMLRASLGDCIAGWRGTWASAGAPAAAIELHLQGQTPLLACGGHAGVVRAAKEGATLLEILTGTDVLASLVGLGSQESGAPLLHAAEHRELAEELRSEILGALADAILRRAGISGARIDNAPGTLGDVARRAATERRVCMSISFSRPATQIVLFLSAALVERLAPPRRANADGKLTRAQSAIGEESVYVEALIGHSQVTLRELAALAPGDVVILDHDLSQNGSLAIRGEVFAEMKLGRSADKRAVTIARVNS